MTPDKQSQKKRILLVDDHPLVREWLTALIEQQTDLAVCGEAATAAEAMQVVVASKPEVAIVDLSLQNCSGMELIKDLKKACPSLVVLVLSMHDESVYAEGALRAGASGYIMKREATKKVIDAIRRVLEGNLYLSDTMLKASATHAAEGKVLANCSPTEQLSDRELVVFDLLGQGMGTRQIAETLQVSMKTVQTYYGRIERKLNLNGVTELLHTAVRHFETRTRGNRPRL